MQTALPLDGPARRQVWSVAKILEDVRDNLEHGYPAIWVRGEIGNFFAARSGHWYFQLQDDNAVLKVAMYRSDNARVPFHPEEGMAVTLGGRLSAFPPRGELQLIANAMEPVGWGSRQLAFEQLKQRLDGEGLFDPARRRRPPLLPDCVGVVTSPHGAAWRDLLRVWERRGVTLRVILSPTRVQGDAAAEEIAAAIRAVDDHGASDVIIVTRGGGSREDLWAFNEEPVARAVAAAGVPVVAAVGHEVDTTIVDLVADLRAATPTAAAEIVAPARDDLLTRIFGAHRRVSDRLAGRVAAARGRLRDRSLARQLERPAQALRVHQQRLDRSWESLRRGLDAATRTRQQRLQAAAAMLGRGAPSAAIRRRERRLEATLNALRERLRGRIHRAREELGRVAGRTEAMSPLAVLGRGYALCREEEGGALLRDSATVSPGDRVAVRLHRGSLRCQVRESLPPDADGDLGAS